MTLSAPTSRRPRRRSLAGAAALAAGALAAGALAVAPGPPPAAALAPGPAPAAATPGAVSADCGGVERAQPARRVSYRPPLAIGDSTMLLALPSLAREGFEVNAHGCRQFPEALDLLRRLALGRLLPHLVVVALGADGSISPDDIGRALAILGPRHLLVLVTPRELGGGSGSDAANVRAAGRAQPQRVRVLDWVAYAGGHGGDWFQPDGLHLTFAGADQFARFLARVLPLAPPPAARPAPAPTPAPTPAPPPPACPTRAPAGSAPGLDPARPAVSLVIAAGVVATTVADPGKVAVGLVNANPFALAATLTIAPAGGPSATACLTLPAVGEILARVALPPALLRRLAVKQRFPVRVAVRVYDAAATTAAVSGAYLLARPARRSTS